MRLIDYMPDILGQANKPVKVRSPLDTQNLAPIGVSTLLVFALAYLGFQFFAMFKAMKKAPGAVLGAAIGMLVTLWTGYAIATSPVARAPGGNFFSDVPAAILWAIVSIVHSAITAGKS